HWFACLRNSSSMLSRVSLDSCPIGRRRLLALGAVTLLGACASPVKSSGGNVGAGPPAAASAPEPSPGTSGSFTVPIPSTPVPGVCPTAPGVIQKPGGPQHYVPCNGTNIALTIDDGPDPTYTPQILALLAKYQIPATFCMIGKHAQANPNLVKAV